MKKSPIFLVLMCCLLLSLCACGKSTDEEVTIATPHRFGNGLWYHIYEDQTSMQVLLEGNPTTGYQWSYDISDPDILSAVFFDYAPDTAAEGTTGTGGVYGGSFEPTGNGSGTVTVTFRYMRSWEGEPAETRTLVVDISSAGLLSIVSADEQKAAE